MVALGIVEDLELVEVDEEKRAATRCGGVRQQRLAQAGEEHGAVGQPGQRVVEGEVVYPLLGALAVGNVGQEPVPQDRAVRLAFRNRAAEHPFLGAARRADAVLGLAWGHGAGRVGERLDDGRPVFGVDKPAEDGRITHRFVRSDLVQTGDAAARIGHRHRPVGSHPDLVQASGHDGRDLVVARLQLEAADGLGHLAHGSIIEKQLARSVCRAPAACSLRSRSARASCSDRPRRRNCAPSRPRGEFDAARLVDWGRHTTRRQCR